MAKWLHRYVFRIGVYEIYANHLLFYNRSMRRTLPLTDAQRDRWVEHLEGFRRG